MNALVSQAARRVALAWLPAFAYMALIWLVSSGPVNVSLDDVPFKDKGVHFVEYGTLALLYSFAIRRSLLTLAWWRAALLAAALTSAWGFLDELHQAFVPSRSSDVYDWLADTLAALCCTCGYFLYGRIRRRSRVQA